MRRISVVSVARSDFSILKPVLQGIEGSNELELHLIASGMHLAPEYGYTVRDMVRDGFSPDDTVELLLASNSPAGIAKSTGLGVVGYADLFARTRPDILLLMGDRFEMFAAAVAAMPFGLPIAHIHGGELSQGAIDDAMRHSISKMAHIHFPATEFSRERLLRMGEKPWRIHVSGAPALAGIKTIELLDKAEIEKRFSVSLDPAPLLVTFHPTTLEFEDTENQVESLLAGLGGTGLPVIITYPNADTASHDVIKKIIEFTKKQDNVYLVQSFGLQGYYSVLKHVHAMVGNSSSGIIEAASFSLPVVNIGNRQKGRECGANVIHCGNSAEDIIRAVSTACDPGFRRSCKNMRNPYEGDDPVGVIVERLSAIPIDAQLMIKQFHNELGR